MVSWQAGTENTNTYMAAKKDEWTWTASDQWTVELKWENPTALYSPMLQAMNFFGIFPRQLVEQGIKSQRLEKHIRIRAILPQ